MDTYTTLSLFFILYLSTNTQAFTERICNGADYNFNCEDQSKVLTIEDGLLELANQPNCPDSPITFTTCQIVFGETYSKVNTPTSITELRNTFYRNCWNKTSCSGTLPSSQDVVWSAGFTQTLTNMGLAPGYHVISPCGFTDDYLQDLRVHMKCVDPKDVGEVTFDIESPAIVTTPKTSSTTIETTTELTEKSEVTPKPTEPSSTKPLPAHNLDKGVRMGLIIFGVNILVLFVALLVTIIVNHIRTIRQRSMTLISAQTSKFTPV